MPTKRPFQKPLREGLFKRVKPFGATAPSAPGPSEDGKLKPFPYNCAIVATAREHLDIECTASQLVRALQSAAELGQPCDGPHFGSDRICTSVSFPKCASSRAGRGILL